MEIFRDHPDRWLHWLTRLPYSNPDTAVQRDTLVRRCFINPIAQNGARSRLVAAGFQVVDCPPPTLGSKKNLADIHLVVAAMELLLQTTRYDEIIILASDSDYVPLLHSLRAHDRRTVVVAGGPTSEALAGSCDRFIDGRTFATALLASEGVILPVSRQPTVPPASSAPPAVKKSPAKKAASKTAARATVAAPAATKKKASATKKTTPSSKTAAKKVATSGKAAKVPEAIQADAGGNASPPDSEQRGTKAVVKQSTAAILQPTTSTEQEARDRVLRIILDAVAQSSTPVKLNGLGTPVRQALKGSGLAPTKAGWLKSLVQQLEPQLPGIKVSGADQGYVYAPDRHRPPGAA